MAIGNSFLFQLLGQKPSFKCRICGNRGSWFLKSGLVNKGQFAAVGKKESGELILECSTCGRRFFFDPLTGGEKWFSEGALGDLLDFAAREKIKEKKKR